jgi:hypothetical protein
MPDPSCPTPCPHRDINIRKRATSPNFMKSSRMDTGMRDAPCSFSYSSLKIDRPHPAATAGTSAPPPICGTAVAGMAHRIPDGFNISRYKAPGVGPYTPGVGVVAQNSGLIPRSVLLDGGSTPTRPGWIPRPPPPRSDRCKESGGFGGRCRRYVSPLSPARCPCSGAHTGFMHE